MEPWDELRILDLTRLYPGPYATMFFADWGADVIKIEQPGVGDYHRDNPPRINGMCAGFHNLNRNKRSITLNLKQDESQELFEQLAATADVLLEGFRPGVMDRLNLGYEALQEVNPSLIYCSLTGYGQNGPLVDDVGHDLNYLSYAGVLGLSGPGHQPPGLPGTQVGDFTGAMLSVIGVLQALYERQHTGSGQYLDISMYDQLISLMSVHLTNHRAGQHGMEPGGELLNGGYVCYNVYQTSDERYVTLGLVEEKFWRRFCELIGEEDLKENHLAPAVDGNHTYDRVRDVLGSRTLEEWTELFRGEDVCYGPVLDPDETLELDHFEARDLSVSVPTGEDGSTMQQIRQPIVYGDRAPEERDHQPAPERGEHTEEILGELGLSPAEINGLRSRDLIE